MGNNFYSHSDNHKLEFIKFYSVQKFRCYSLLSFGPYPFKNTHVSSTRSLHSAADIPREFIGNEKQNVANRKQMSMTLRNRSRTLRNLKRTLLKNYRYFPPSDMVSASYNFLVGTRKLLHEYTFCYSDVFPLIRRISHQMLQRVAQLTWLKIIFRTAGIYIRFCLFFRNLLIKYAYYVCFSTLG